MAPKEVARQSGGHADQSAKMPETKHRELSTADPPTPTSNRGAAVHSAIDLTGSSPLTEHRQAQLPPTSAANQQISPTAHRQNVGSPSQLLTPSRKRPSTNEGQYSGREKQAKLTDFAFAKAVPDRPAHDTSETQKQARLGDTEQVQTSRLARFKGGASRSAQQFRTPEEQDIIEDALALPDMDPEDKTRHENSQAHPESKDNMLHALLAAINAVQVETFPEVVEGKEDQVHPRFDSLFDRPAIKGRTWKVALEHIKGTGANKLGRWVYAARDGNSYRYFGSRLVAELRHERDARKVNEELVNLLNSFPGTTLDSISVGQKPKQYSMTRTQTMIVRAAELRVLPNLQLYLSRAAFKSKPNRDNGYELHCEVWLFDPATLVEYRPTVVISLSDLAADTIVRPFPPNVALARRMGHNKVDLYDTFKDEHGHTIVQSMIPDDIGPNDERRPRFELAQRVADIFMVETHGMIISASDFESWKSAWMGKLRSNTGGKASANPSIYAGKPLYYVERNIATRKHIIAPSKAVNKNTKGRLPRLSINSLDRARILPVLDAMAQKFRDCGDPKEAWMIACHATKTANEDITARVPTTSDCNCEPSMRDYVEHACGACGNGVICSMLTMGILGLRVCASCLQHERKKGASLPHRRMIQLALVKLWAEADIVGIAQDSERQKLDRAGLLAAIDSLFKNDPKLYDAEGPLNSNWLDTFTQQYRNMAAEHEFGPLELSVDAIDPYVLGAEGGTRIHAGENVKPVAHALNYYKHIQLPAWLEYSSKHVTKKLEWLEQEMDSTDLNEADARKLWATLDRLRLEADEQLVDQSEALRKTRLKASWSKQARINKTVPPAQMVLDKQEFLTGELRPRDRDPDLPWNKSNYSTNNLSNHHAPITKADINRAMKIIEEIEQEFGVELPRSEDGCPWFGVETRMIPGYNWTFLKSFVNARYHRMWEECNGRYKTIDEPIMIFVFIVLTVCIMRGKLVRGQRFSIEQKKKLKRRYGEFLGLPFTLEQHDALCIAIGKAEHGSRMFSGFPAGATSFSQWQESKCNMVAEGRCSNYGKLDFSKDTYPAIRQLITEINLPKSIFDPDAANMEIDVIPGMVDNIPTSTQGFELDVDQDDARPPPKEVMQRIRKEAFADLSDDDDDEGDILDHYYAAADISDQGPDEQDHTAETKDEPMHDAGDNDPIDMHKEYARYQAFEREIFAPGSILQHDPRVVARFDNMRKAYHNQDQAAFWKYVQDATTARDNSPLNPFAKDPLAEDRYLPDLPQQPLNATERTQALLLQTFHSCVQRARTRAPDKLRNVEVRKCFARMLHQVDECLMDDFFKEDGKIMNLLKQVS